jgi:hypothetical protein
LSKKSKISQKILFDHKFLFLVTSKNGVLSYHKKIRGVSLDYTNDQRLSPDKFIEICNKLGTNEEVVVELPKDQIRKKDDNLFTVPETKVYKGVNNKGILQRNTDDRVRHIR